MNKDLRFYGSIAYTVLGESNKDHIRLKLNVGDVVELEEESEGIAYARIKAIFWHQANDGRYYAFFLFDWFKKKLIKNNHD